MQESCQFEKSRENGEILQFLRKVFHILFQNETFCRKKTLRKIPRLIFQKNFYLCAMQTREIFQKDLELIREKAPLIHNITNFVVMNNTANALLAIGASPVMAHAIEEVADMVKIASALVINMGTLEHDWVQSMIVAGKAANAKGIPVVFDPVGVGATPYRSQAAAEILQHVKPTIIRANASEIMSLARVNVQTKGVDSTNSADDAITSAKILAKETGAIVVVSGAVDVITDGENVKRVLNGHPLMGRVTGMGCTATAILAAFAAVEKNAFDAAYFGMTAMGIAGEIAGLTAKGNGTMQLYFLDALCNLSENAATFFRN